MLYVTGDVHGFFGRIVRFCSTLPSPSRDDVVVLLGDVCANYWCDESDMRIRQALGNLPVTVLCVHGNHEARPEACPGYVEAEWRGGRVFRDVGNPGLLFAIDGSVYDIDSMSCLVAGGAYSVDKRFRIDDGRRWFADEQPSSQERARVEEACASRSWEVDYVFSHTVPLRYRPTEAFMANICQDDVDISTEEWLEALEARLAYRHWYCGHFHVNQPVAPKISVLFKDVVCLPGGAVAYDAAADVAVVAESGFYGVSTAQTMHAN